MGARSRIASERRGHRRDGRRWRIGLPGVAILLFTATAGRAGAADAIPAVSLDQYWALPLAPQGDAPASWSAVERALEPEACGQCHAEKYEEWRGSLHARAFSPGLVGQLLTYDEEQAAACMQCHAPLAEQARAFAAARARGQGHARTAQGLAAAGNSCAACHLRGHRRYGPPSRGSGETGQSAADGAPHGGVYRTAIFEDSAFCSACHQFPPEAAVNGKPLENTYAEWRASPQAARGITCQGCHMPERRHLWRGIHDPDTVASGLSARFVATAGGARFELTNSGVGHAFPTYVTPKVVMRAVTLDRRGRPRPETAARRVIQRIVAFEGGEWVERADTRLLPGETATLFLPWQGSRKVRMWLEVAPDDYYEHEVYPPLLRHLPAESPSARLIAEAAARTGDSRYTLFETTLSRPD